MTSAETDAIHEPAPQFRPRRLGHANFWVRDIETATAFYNRVVGLRVECTEPGLKAGFLGNGNTHHDIALVEITRGEDRLGRDGQVQIPKEISGRAGLFHLGWEMATEHQLVEAIRRTKPEWKKPGMVVDHQIAHSIFVPDPDGNFNEFYADMLKDWRSIFQGEMDLITSNWDPEAQAPLTEPQYDPAPKLYGVEGAPLKPRRTSRATLVCADFAGCLEFYTEVAGLEPILVERKAQFAILAGALGEHNLSLCAAGGELSPGLHHTSFEAQDEAAVIASVNDLKAQGIPVEREIDDAAKRSVFVKDTDGILCELFVDRSADYGRMGAFSPAERVFML